MAPIVLALGLGACHGAEATFRPYDIRPSAVIGQGGTHETVKGIDLWTSGDPPRRYQVIGTIQLAGRASPEETLADKVREAGGNAAIRVMSYKDDQNSTPVRVAALQADATYYVVKYLD
ncbi:hypothetical protein [Rhodovastum atsumiense]|uniref:Uncharacterized protein n=1 Tax=Rhodovastum atsumiense TaxID=504468 RepID=A0A5M6IVN8_9PROT|nr:hypothetical protein [Rhodovastum atsumiense]KAA5611485.1 hypothetical protein F1189_14235 [Rhodovastum atsumiense]